MQEAIFTAALGVESPWFVESVAFDAEHKRLDIRLDFERGSRFEVDGARCPVHDTVEKSWRHLNFFQHECYCIPAMVLLNLDWDTICVPQK
jgi:transposase